MMVGELKAFHYDLVIHAENAQQADRVMVERVGFDEDLSEYGVGEYRIDAQQWLFGTCDSCPGIRRLYRRHSSEVEPVRCRLKPVGE